ncbi:Uncharcterized protein, DUF927 family [Azotobacter beijerinckii]|uniref:Uncharcterized protein, DUF927 family n=1 Tax=Azotobacter beijerinckii TaxID=170623 RepID=A0A1H6XZM0_9GAMM|nr:DUF927 domain-containing protein [Azotobacter beijerinckii]SEJ33084.1 Uncharcterized protein, DUF927 family [Azotobacter beijerinckii]
MTDHKPKHPSFAEVKAASLQAIERVLAHWLSGGKRVDGGKEYTAPNPLRADKHAGSLKVNLARGTWADFATGDKGGDLIDLVQYLERCTHVEACNKLADFLGVTAGASPTPAGSGTGKAKAPDWVPVLPIPDAAMARVYKDHRQHGTPSKVWVYRDAEGRPLMVLYRFDKAPDAEGKREKVFAPLTWCRNTAGAHQWRWSGLPEPRPLLRLDEVAQRPDAPVVVCEGEKSADAAAVLLPDHVATCWPNGSKSWHKADLAPLAGRDVLLWPDNDAGGLECMAAVAERLRQLGAASVRVLALEVFERRPVVEAGIPALAAGGEWSPGDDAADALARGWTAAHLAVLAQSGELYAAPMAAPAAASAIEPGASPAPAKAAGRTASRAKRQPARSQGVATDSDSGDQPAGFKVTDAGVFYYGDDGAPVPVCSRLDILARTRDDNGHNWGLMVEFDDPDGARKRLNIPSQAMAGEFGKEVVGPLVSMGLRLAQGRKARNCKDNLQSYLQAYDSPERARLVNRLGWHGDAYLLPDEQLGSQAEHLHFYEGGAALPPIEQAGTLEQWQDGVARYCVDNNRLAFVVSAAFAGPLLHLLRAESGGFHLYGDSSGGKTTHLKAAASVYGGPRMLRTWRHTGNALEGTAAAHSDGLLVLDEIHQCDPREVGEIVYMLGNGTGKTRANDRGAVAKQAYSWRLLFLSTGEKTLGQHIADGGKDLKAGMEVRMVGIPADAGKGLGLFEALHGFPNAGELAEAIAANAEKFHGEALVTFLRAMLESKPRPKMVEDLERVTNHIAAQLLPPDAGQQARRVAARFALVATAGELATRLGVTGWPEHTAWQAARVCFKAWLDARGGAGNLEEDAIVSHLRTLIELHGEARFTRWENVDATTDPHAPRTVNRLGFRRSHERDPGDGQPAALVLSYYVLGGVWASEIWKGYNVANVNKVLLARGILTPGSNGSASRSERLPGMGKTRCYLVNPAALFADHQPEQLANAA